MSDSRPTSFATLAARSDTMTLKLDDDAMAYTCERVFGAPPERMFRAFTDPADLRVWFPAGAPPGTELTVCESDPIEGGSYHYEMVMPEYGTMTWHGRYEAIDRPGRLDANEWFVMGGGPAEGPPSEQTLTFEPHGEGCTFLTMRVVMPAPEDPEEFMEQTAAGLGESLAAMDELVSGR